MIRIDELQVGLQVDHSYLGRVHVKSILGPAFVKVERAADRKEYKVSRAQLSLASEQTPRGSNELPAPVVCKLKMEDIESFSGQRAIRQSRVKWLVDHFEENRCAPLIVSLGRDGKKRALSGGHRREALLLLGYEEWHCVLYKGLTSEQEASVAVAEGLNWTLYRRHVTGIAARDSEALSVDMCLRRFSLKFQELGQADSVGSIKAVAAVYKVHDRGLRHCLSTLSVASESWHREPRSLTANSILMISDLVAAVKDFDAAKSRLIKVLSRYELEVWLDRGRRHDRGRLIVQGLSDRQIMTYMVREAHNKGLEPTDPRFINLIGS